MSDQEKIQTLLMALKEIEIILGIKRDFVPLGPAVPIATIIRDARRAVAEKTAA